MRFIDQHEVGLSIDAKWKHDATMATLHVAIVTSDDKQRKIVIDMYQKLWGAIKDKLAQVSHGKCWYCDSAQPRADNNVDHFRPKNRVAGCSDHEGYWWLAFDWQNYRYSCTYCNSQRRDKVTGGKGGKHDYFPLVDDTKRAKVVTDNYSLEFPMLLDPTIAYDVTLLTFNENGEAIPADTTMSSIDFVRAEKSIELYHLNYSPTQRKRRTIYQHIDKLVKRGDRCYAQALQSQSSFDEQYCVDVTQDLKELLKSDADFSKAARDYLCLFSRTRKWVATILAEIEKEV